MKTKNSCIIVLSICFITCQLLAQPEENKSLDKQQFCSLGNFTLESGEKIYDCKIGYRTYGKTNAAKSNIILFPTWFGGTSSTLEEMIPGKIIDTFAYHLILVDALGNGVSSSPSNSNRQPRLQFPKFSIRDMVESQYQMLTKNLKIQHVYAIVGISMGGQQSFQWSVSHPDFADKIIPIVGSPQNTSYDLLLWRGLLQTLERDTAYRNGNYTELPQIADESVMWNLLITTPENVVNTISRDSFENWFMKIQIPGAFDWNNMHRQIEAIIGNDVSKTVNGSLEEAGKIIKTKMLIILAKQDHIVNPLPAIKIADMVKAKVLSLESNCGHLAFICESEKIAKAVNEFLSAK
jgi:homoserine O-acetyltransferase